MKYTNETMGLLTIIHAHKIGALPDNMNIEKFKLPILAGDLTSINKAIEHLNKSNRLEEVKTSLKNQLNKKVAGGALNDIDGFVSIFDEELKQVIKSTPDSFKKDIPFIIFYKGDIQLIADISKNIAIIGSREITNPQKERAEFIMKCMTEINNDFHIVSGLATGSDTYAHKFATNNGMKTIATLSTTISKYRIYPAENKDYAYEIVEKGGLLISEYYTDPIEFRGFHADNRIGRLIARDRLQSMFSSSIILLSGDKSSGSKHAMNKAYNYNRTALAMFNAKKDIANKSFGLAEDLIVKNKADSVTKRRLYKILGKEIK